MGRGSRLFAPSQAARCVVDRLRGDRRTSTACGAVAPGCPARAGSVLAALLVAALPGTTSAQWTQLGQDINGSWDYDNLGVAVALSSNGSRIIAGAANTAPDLLAYVTVLEYQAPAWHLLVNIGSGPQDGTGRAVAMSADGSRIAIGAPFYQSDRGRVTVREDLQGSWETVGDDFLGDPSAHARLGLAVALSADGSRVAIGSPLGDGYAAASGVVRVYDLHPGSPSYWQQAGQDLKGIAQGDDFGFAVSMSADGTRVAIGAPQNDNNGLDAGEARVYRFNSSDGLWYLMATAVPLVGDSQFDEFGFAVALSADGRCLAVGAPYRDGLLGTEDGQVRVFQWNTFTGWVQRGQSIGGEASDDHSGWSVALSGDGARVAIGAPDNNGTNGPGSGHVRVWEYQDASWVRLGQDIDGSAPMAGSGFAVALSRGGGQVAIGAPYHSGSEQWSGQVQVYRFEIFRNGFESGDTGAWSDVEP